MSTVLGTHTYVSASAVSRQQVQVPFIESTREKFVPKERMGGRQLGVVAGVLLATYVCACAYHTDLGTEAVPLFWVSWCVSLAMPSMHVQVHGHRCMRAEARDACRGKWCVHCDNMHKHLRYCPCVRSIFEYICTYNSQCVKRRFTCACTIMCTCECMYIYTQIHTWYLKTVVRIYVCTYLYVAIYIGLCICMYIYTHLCIYIYRYKYMWRYVDIDCDMYIYIHIYSHVFTYAFTVFFTLYVCICMYIYTYTNTFTRTCFHNARFFLCVRHSFTLVYLKSIWLWCVCVLANWMIVCKNVLCVPLRARGCLGLPPCVCTFVGVCVCVCLSVCVACIHIGVYALVRLCMYAFLCFSFGIRVLWMPVTSMHASYVHFSCLAFFS